MAKDKVISPNPVAVVTGGGRGIGRAVCLELARRGYNVVVNYAHSSDAAAQTATDCAELGVESIAVKADVSDHDEAKGLIDAAMIKYGRIDVLVNNAGITRDGLMMKMSPEDFDAVIRTNMNGAFNCMKHVSRIMLKARGGSIVNVASIVGLTGNAGQVNYSASKAGVVAMTKSAAKELGSRGVRVNAVAPGYIETDMTKDLPQEAAVAFADQIALKRLGQPEDVAKVVAFLAGDDAGYVTGQVICVDGGIVM